MDVPPAIRSFVEGARYESVHIGKSAASVFRLRTPGGTLFLKTCAVTGKDGLGTEADRLRWLAGRLSVPEDVSFAKDDAREYLLVTSLPEPTSTKNGSVAQLKNS